MFAIIIMLLVMLEVFFACLIVFLLIKYDKDVSETNKEVTLIRKEIINVLSDYRISLRMINQQIKKIKSDIQTKQILDTINFIGTASILLGIKKKSICK